MAKNFFYNLIICGLLVCLIIIATYVLMYNKIPTSTNVLQEKIYTRSDEVKAYLDTDAQETEKYIIKSYEVNDYDLTELQKENIYKAGKSNPFDEYKNVEVQNNTNIDNVQANITNPQDNFARDNNIGKSK